MEAKYALIMVRHYYANMVTLAMKISALYPVSAKKLLDIYYKSKGLRRGHISRNYFVLAITSLACEE
jgi:hypothetical protein